jgi:hypothetical protein
LSYREEKVNKKGKIIKMVGSHFGGGSRGPPIMEAWKGDLEGPQKWRAIWRLCWRWIFAPNLQILE